jgi:metallo-beta-lactamase family protein
MEATYGNRLHDEVVDRLPRFAAVIQRTFDRGGNVVIPSFAVGRTQEMLYFIRQIKEQNLVKGHDNFPVYVDSPLAIEATEIFNENTYGFYDEEAMALIKKGINPIGFDNLRKTVTADESKAINFDKTPKIIISASGMCEAGRIRHHLKHNLWHSESTVLFVGYQAAGTLGRKILDGAQKVKLFGEEIAVYADVVSFGGFSAHADRDELLDWLRQLKTPPKRVFIVHGEDGVVDEFADLVTQELGFAATAPYLKETHDLLQNTLLKEGVRQARIAKTRTSRVKTLYTGLQSAEKTLRSLIDRSEGIPNKKMREFTKDLEAIIKKWSS